MQKDKKIENISQLVEMAGDNLSILEEEVDVGVQGEFLSLSRQLAADRGHFADLQKSCLEDISSLFSPETAPDDCKRMLAVLCTLNDISVYRTLEHFSRLEGPLQKWGVIAMQQSRMVIQNNLLDEEPVYISTGLGGHNGLLRYFCLLFYNGEDRLKPYEEHLVSAETTAALTAAGGSIEEISFHEGHLRLLALLPLKADLQALFNGIIGECNQYGNFLHTNLLLTNVRKLSETEIGKLLEIKGRPSPHDNPSTGSDEAGA